MVNILKAIFITEAGVNVPAVSGEEMCEVDRVAVEEFGLGILQMMENAGRNLASMAMEMVDGSKEATFTILAGTGGNGGGGLCCARHLHNRGYEVNLVLTKEPEEYRGAAGAQLNILMKAGLRSTPAKEVEAAIRSADVTIDALIGYSLKGAPDGRAAELIEVCNGQAQRVLSLDLPSGIDATSGETPGVFVRPERTMTLALPKTGLRNPEAGELFLADIGIPPEVFARIGLTTENVSGQESVVSLRRGDN